MNNQKIENQLNLSLDIPVNERDKSKSLSTGYNKVTNTWELIIKYNGDLSVLSDDVMSIEILTNQYAIITVPETNINKIVQYSEVEYIEKPKDLEFMLNKSTRLSCINSVWEAPPNLTGKGVLVGIIDTGIDYLHPDFRNEDGTTRIDSILDLSEGAEGEAKGVVYSREDINSALKTKTREEALQIVPSYDRQGHGTHVAGIAAGNGRASKGKNKGVAFESDLIIVKLGGIVPSYFYKTTEIMRGIAYIISRAQELKKPVAINLSFGNNYGSHDGNSLFETYLNTMSDEWKNNIVVGSGNDGASAHHYQNSIKEGETQTVDLTISPFEEELSIQLWKEYYDVLQVEIIAPSGERSGFIKPTLGTQTFVLNGTKVFLYFGEPAPYNSAQEIYFVLLPTGKFITEGIWKLNIKADKIVVGNYNLWLPTSTGINKDTKFSEPAINTTLTIPSTSAKVITVGAYDQNRDSIASFSGRGYTRLTNQVKPDLVAPGVEVTSTVPGGRYESQSGTSMATPFVTGATALLMEWGIVRGNDPFLYGQKIKAYLQKSARRSKGTVYPNQSFGYGRLCLGNVFEDIPVASRVLSTNLLYQSSNIENDQMSSTSIRTYGENCKETIVSEEYVDTVVEYQGSIDAIIEKYNPKCIQIIDEQYAILHIPIGPTPDCSTKPDFYNVEIIPKLISTYSKSALNKSGILVFHDKPYVPLTGASTLIGIIDTGIDYLHDTFRYEDNTTKIVYLWDQTIVGNPPENFEYGSEYSRETIDRAISSEDPYSIVPSKDTIGHGTFLSGIAAGREVENADFIGAAPDAELLVVKLKGAKKCLRDYYLVEEDANPVYQDTDLILAVKYLVEKSNELNKPLSIIIGLGSNEGAHDGSSITESYLREVANKKGNVVSIAAGNEANKGHHHQGFFNKGEREKQIEINVAKGERGFIVNIWNTAPDKMSIAITSPTGEYIGKIPARLTQSEKIKLILEETIINIDYELSEERTGDQLISIRMEKPTEGIWTITLFGDFIVNGRYDAWLPRESFIKDTTKFLMPTPFTTVTFPSTSISVITSGAYNHQTGSLYLASGRGLTRDLELKPDLVAPGVNVIGPLPGNRFGSMTGTSIGAAMTGGAAALLLEWGIVLGNDIDMDTQKVNNYLIRGATRKDTIDYPNREWGYGELNLLGTFEALRGEKE